MYAYQHSVEAMASIITQTWARLTLSAYWLSLLGAAVALASHPASSLLNLSILDQRKYFHALAVLLFLPVRRLKALQLFMVVCNALLTLIWLGSCFVVFFFPVFRLPPF